MKKLLLIPFLLFCIAVSAEGFKSQYDELAANTSLNDTDRLHKLLALDWERGLREAPEFATMVGDARFNDRWSDNSQSAIEARKAALLWPLAVLERIDRANLSKQDRLNYGLFRRDVQIGIEGHHFPGELLAISQLGGVHQAVAQVLQLMPMDSVKAYENILARLRAIPALVNQDIELLKRGAKQGVTPPKSVLGQVPQQIQNLIPSEALDSELLRPFRKFPESFAQPDQARLRAAVIAAYNEQVVPAFKNLQAFITAEYLPAARPSIGWNDLPNGAEWYAFLVRVSTTATLTPKELYELGLREIKRIRDEMQKVLAETEFKGDLEAFNRYLRNDGQFFYSKPGDLLAGYRDIAKRIDPQLTLLFGRLPRLPYGVKEVPAYAEKEHPVAHYEPGSTRGGRPGWFFANTGNLSSRPKWQMESLTLHEAVPGHHLQTALAEEMENVPEFRKFGGYEAYVEGWGLYSESLGQELGLYQDPYSRYGALTLEMWRAVRLVVDTGIHAFGWSRAQGIDLMRKETGKDAHEAEVEIDRYMVWAGQALAYKVGQLKIRELRDYASRELGNKFDVRAFHDKVLGDGALPLDILETSIKAWVAEKKQS